jgi:hypothetical protein
LPTAFAVFVAEFDEVVVCGGRCTELPVVARRGVWDATPKRLAHKDFRRSLQGWPVIARRTKSLQAGWGATMQGHFRTQPKRSNPAKRGGYPFFSVPRSQRFAKVILTAYDHWGIDSQAVGVPKFRRRNFGTYRLHLSNLCRTRAYHHLCCPCHSCSLCPTASYPSSPSSPRCRTPASRPRIPPSLSP